MKILCREEGAIGCVDRDMSKSLTWWKLLEQQCDGRIYQVKVTGERVFNEFYSRSPCEGQRICKLLLYCYMKIPKQNLRGLNRSKVLLCIDLRRAAVHEPNRTLLSALWLQPVLSLSFALFILSSIHPSHLPIITLGTAWDRMWLLFLSNSQTDSRLRPPSAWALLEWLHRDSRKRERERMKEAEGLRSGRSRDYSALLQLAQNLWSMMKENENQRKERIMKGGIQEWV